MKRRKVLQSLIVGVPTLIAANGVTNWVFSTNPEDVLMQIQDTRLKTIIERDLVASQTKISQIEPFAIDQVLAGPYIVSIQSIVS